MKEIKLNHLNKKQRRLLQYGVILILLLFLSVFYFIQQKDNLSGGKEVYLEDSTLHVFDDEYTFKGYPDRISVHYPHFIFVQANKPLTIVYNLETKQKEKEINDVLLDYYDGNIVYNRQETYFNDINLGEFCDSAFIKNSNEVLCITKQSRDFADNMLININPEAPNLWKRVYQSDNILTTVSVINGDAYIGEINFETKQNYLTINNDQTIPVETPVNMIFEMDGEVYFVSFESEMSEGNVFYKIADNKTIKQETNRVFLYK